MAGTIIPPSAAATGKEAFLIEFNSPIVSSFLISKPTRKKKTAIKPSLIQWDTERLKILKLSKIKYVLAKSEFAKANARIVEAAKTTLEEDSI